ncbi:MAG: peptide ABC transporter permease [Chloroflexi bacterium]|nr:MAG: peptide ABC transporter permease [Chloroflexota bacterium]
MQSVEKTWFERTDQEEAITADETLVDVPTEKDEKIYVASYWKLMWWRFLKHRMAVISAVIVILLYGVAAFCEFVAPYNPEETFVQYKLAPPTRIHIFDSEGNLRRPFVYRIQRDRDPETLRSIYTEDTSTIYPIRFFVEAGEYKMWNRWTMNRHLFGLDVPREEQGIFLLGADRLGRDVFSRISFGARISLTIGLVSVVLSLVLGILLGGLSGFYGGTIDNLIQRLIEFIRSVPEIPLIMGLAAALPADWPVTRLYFGVTIVLSLIGWTGLARVVRGRFLSLREEDFVMAARLSGSSEMRIIFRHMLPSFLSHIIASLTLAIPAIILAETGLSFIGLGLRAPAISWGVLLQEAQNVRSMAFAPWVLTPAIAVIVSVLAFNFLGDGIRDAADPYAR